MTKLQINDITRGNKKQDLLNYIGIINEGLHKNFSTHNTKNIRATKIAGRIINFLNNNNYYDNEGQQNGGYYRVVTEEGIRAFVSRLQRREDNNNRSDEGVNMRSNEEVNNNTTAQYDDDGYDIDNFPTFNNNNDNNDNFSENQMSEQQPIQISPQARDVLMRAIRNFNYASAVPIQQQEIPQNPAEIVDLLITRLATLQPRHGAGRTVGRNGMDALKAIVLDIKRDIKRVSKAMSLEGAQDIANKHNAKYPNDQSKHWRAENRDINGDNIPDITIRNANNDLLFVNGYTTKKSDWPIRYEWYKEFPTSDARKAARQEHPTMSSFARSKFNVGYVGDQEEDWNGELHDLGNATTYTTPEAWRNYNLAGYTGHPTKKRNMSAYDRFKHFIITDVINDVMAELEQQHHYHIPGKYKTKIIAKTTAEIWKNWIVSRIAQQQNYNLSNPVELDMFDKWKKKAQGKDAFNNTVTDLLYHLNRTNNEVGWTDEKRHELVIQLYNETRTIIVHYLTELTQAEERQGHQYIQTPGEHGAINVEDVVFDGDINGEIENEFIHEHNGEWGNGQHPVPFSANFNHQAPHWD